MKKKTKNKKITPVEDMKSASAALTPIQQGKLIIMKDLLTIKGFQLLETTKLKEQMEAAFIQDAIAKNLVSPAATPEAKQALFNALWTQIQTDAAQNAQSVGKVLQNLKPQGA